MQMRNADGLVSHILGHTSMNESTLHQAKRILIDGIAAIVAGALWMPESFHPQAIISPSKEDCTVFCAGIPASAAMAAYTNAAFAQMHDFNDGLVGAGEDGGSYHPGRVLVPVALALGELQKTSGRALLEALAIGYDLAYSLRWAECSPPAPPYPDAVAATAMAGRLRDLPSSALWGCLGAGEFLAPCKLPKAGYQAATNYLGYAVVARHAVELTALAENGLCGIAPTFVRTAISFEATRGLAFVYHKPYPTCRVTHAAIEMLLAMRVEAGFATKDIAAIDAFVPAPLVYVDAPTDTDSSAKRCEYSMQYALACAAVDGEVGLAQFQPERLADEALHALARRVRVLPLALDEGNGSKRQFALEVLLQDGQCYRRETHTVYGDPNNPMTDEALSQKLRDASRGWFDADAVLQAAWSLENAPDVSALLAPLRTAV